MKAIILAAGVGKRLWPVTQYKPKCLIEIGGQTARWVRLSHASDGAPSLSDFSLNDQCAAGVGAFLAQQALAYARIYAENDEALSAELNDIALPRAAKPRKPTPPVDPARPPPPPACRSRCVH